MGWGLPGEGRGSGVVVGGGGSPGPEEEHNLKYGGQANPKGHATQERQFLPPAESRSSAPARSV